MAAARLLLSAERKATEYDILISTALEFLEEEPKSTAELQKAVNEVWPGCGIDEARVEAAMRVAVAAGYVVSVPDATYPAWALTKVARAELEASRNWARDTIRRTARQLRERAASGYGAVSEEEALRFVEILSKALFAGVSTAYRVYEGAVEMRSGRWLLPTSYDTNAMFAVVERTTSRPAISELLKAMLLAALDTSDSFGDDLVTSIATGYMLHAFLARRDLVGAQRSAGKLAGEWLILDTPILLSLLGRGRLAKAMEGTIKGALVLGMRVMVYDHTMDELQEVLGRVERYEVPQVEAALRTGADVEVLRQTIDEPLIATWLAADGWGRRLSWAEFREYAAGLRSRLSELGVMRVAHRNRQKGDTAKVEACRAALAQRIETTGRERGDKQIQRDAETMAAVWRLCRGGKPKGSVWPGSWVLTMDLRMGPAYAKVNPADRCPLTLRPSQLVSVLSACSEPASLEQLAQAAAALASQEAMLAVACKYPPKVAIQIARALSLDAGASEVDIRVAQLPLAELLESQPDTILRPEEAGAQFSAAVVSKRSERMAAALKLRTEQLAVDQDRASRAVESAQQMLSQEREARVLAESRLLDKEREIHAVRDRGAVERSSINRRWWIRLAVLTLVVVAGLALSQRFFGFAAGTALSAAFLWARSGEWVDKPEASWTKLLVAASPELLTLFDIAGHGVKL